MTSLAQRTADLATWTGGKFKAAAAYTDQALASAKSYTDAAVSSLTTSLTASLQQYADNKDAQLKQSILGTASAAYDTLGELQAGLQADQTGAAALASALGTRVDTASAQTFTTAQQAQGRANIGAASTADLGADTDFVALANAALSGS